MEEIKELEEAQIKLWALLKEHLPDAPWKPEEVFVVARQILNLKGDGWSMAIVDPEIYGANPAYKRVIWQAE